MGDHEDITGVLRQYNLIPTSAPMLIGTGTLNWNYAVDTNSGRRFVRKHRDNISQTRIEDEHALIAWASQHSVPVAPAERTRAGRTVVEHADALWAVFPWIDGHAPVRGALDAAQAYAAGEMHGRIQRVLADYSVSSPAEEIRLDVGASVGHLERILEVARGRRAEQWILDGLELQLSLLLKHGPDAPTESLGTGLCHGDYHDQQLLFDREARITAVTDWELFGIRPRLWEVIRSLWFSQIMEQPAMADYVAGYREHMPLSERECRLGMELWWQGRLHSAWAFQAYFLEGNERASQFFQESFRALRALADDAARADLTERFVRAATRPV